MKIQTGWEIGKVGMIDRKKVISDLSASKRILCYPQMLTPEIRIKIGYAISDAIDLLKEQEAVKPKLVGENMWRCGKCDALLGWEDFTPSGVELVEYKFCPECGRMVKWDE